MRVARSVLRAVTALATVGCSLGAPVSSAAAAPPEGCIGLPATPAAFVCVTQFTPANAVPTVQPGPGQTVVVPEFCVFQCFGPTPVTVPGVTVTQGSGLIAVITYNGATYRVQVGPAPDIPTLVQQAQQTISGAVATVLGTAAYVRSEAERTVGGVVAQVPGTVDYVRSEVDYLRSEAESLVPDHQFTFDANLTIGCYGCGSYGPAGNSLSGTVTGYAGTQVFVFAPVSASFWINAGTGIGCVVSFVANGTMTLPFGQATFTWTQLGPVASIAYTLQNGTRGSITAALRVSSSNTLPCGSAVTATMAGAGGSDAP